MFELANTEDFIETATIEDLALAARSIVTSMKISYWQLGRVLVQAKDVVPHGEWGKWLEENAECGVSQAESIMEVYRRFRDIPQLADVGKTKLFRLLPLPEEKQSAFLEANDVSRMSTREIERAVKAAREEEQAKARAEREQLMAEQSRAYDQQVNARLAAEKALKTLQEQPPRMPEVVQEMLSEKQETINSQMEEIVRLRTMSQDSIDARRTMENENRQLKEDARMMEEALNDQQREADEARARVRELESLAARGDADREIANYLTIGTLTAAVQSFLGACVQLPQMRRNFAAMPQEEKQEYETLLDTVEDWVNRSRKAIGAHIIEGEAIGHVR